MTSVMKNVFLRDCGVLCQTWLAMMQRIDQEPNTTPNIDALINYIMNAGELTEPKIFLQTISEGLSASKRERIMTGAERLRYEGRLEGEQLGEQRGQKQGAFSFLLGQLKRKFGPVPECYQEYIQQASSEQLQALGLKLLDAENLDALFEEAMRTVRAQQEQSEHQEVITTA